MKVVMLEGSIAFRGLNGSSTDKRFFQALVGTIRECGWTFVLFVQDGPDITSQPFWEHIARQCGADYLWRNSASLRVVHQHIVFSATFPLPLCVGETRCAVVVNPDGRVLQALEAARYDEGRCSRLEIGDGCVEAFRCFSAPCQRPFVSRAEISHIFPSEFAHSFRRRLQEHGLVVFE